MIHKIWKIINNVESQNSNSPVVISHVSSIIISQINYKHVLRDLRIYDSHII